MFATNPHRGYNRTDFHMCGGCGQLLYLTGERRVRRSLLLNMPVFFGITFIGFYLLRNVEGLSLYREARHAREPNFLGFLIICAAIAFALTLLSRFEVIGQTSPIEKTDNRQ